MQGPSTSGDSSSGSSSSMQPQPSTSGSRISSVGALAAAVAQRLGGLEAHTLEAAWRALPAPPAAASTGGSKPSAAAAPSLDSRPRAVRTPPKRAAALEEGVDWDALSQYLQPNLSLLAQHLTPIETRWLAPRLLPGVLSADLPAWLGFFEGLGIVDAREFARALVYSPTLFLHSTPYIAGSAILHIRGQMGLQDSDVIERLVPCYPEVMCLSVDELEKATKVLSLPGLLDGPAAILRILRQCPGLLAPEQREWVAPIGERIRNSRAGKFTNSGSYWV
ncbi:hypothetical protein FOA52_008878 [Chlamydomonas sp. UWO 241]|nr:hypothetical protein FOA52_008878 [Chlamydomonas sp. UWO 241]